MSYTPAVFRAAGGRRQFVTMKNVSDKATAALLFQQTISDGSRVEIVALERISVVFRPRETKRLSISVEDVWNRIRSVDKPGVPISRPVLAVVAVEFLDGSTWSAPSVPAGR